MGKFLGKHGTLACASVLAACVLGATWISTPVFFESNDDTGILGLVAGFRTGSPTPGTVYCSVAWGWVFQHYTG